MTDSADDHLVGTTYEPRLALAGRRSPAFVRPFVGACIVAGLGISLGFAVLAVRNLSKSQPPPLYAMSTLSVPVEIATPAPSPPAGPAAAPLDVLPADMARAAAARPAVQAGPTLTPELPRRADPGFSCRRPDTPSARLVCGDAQLTRLHRGMTRAFDAAVAAGVPYDSLRQDQDDWLRVREDAARLEGPDGVAGMYRQRIAELKDMAASF